MSLLQYSNFLSSKSRFCWLVLGSGFDPEAIGAKTNRLQRDKGSLRSQDMGTSYHEYKARILLAPCRYLPSRGTSHRSQGDFQNQYVCLKLIILGATWNLTFKNEEQMLWRSWLWGPRQQGRNMGLRSPFQTCTISRVRVHRCAGTQAQMYQNIYEGLCLFLSRKSRK